MRRPTLQKLRVLILILDEYWRHGIAIRAKEIERRLSNGRGIDMAERTVHFALDSLVADNYLTVSQLGHEKFYYVNEQLDSRSIRDEVVGILGLARWIPAGGKSRSASGGKSLKPKAGQR